MPFSEQELNRKLAEWAGFRPFPQKGWEGEYAPPEGVQVVWTTFRPRFTQSLDQCFKWLAPKLFHLDWNLKLFSDDGYYFAQLEKQDQSDEWSSVVGVLEPALAFCLAVELLADEETTNALR